MVKTGLFEIGLFRRFSAFQLESKKLSQLVHKNTISSFRLDISNDKQWDIDLEPAIITTANYHLKVLTPQGTQTLISHADFLYKGKVKGSNKDEQVRLAIKDGFIYGSIQTGGKEYFHRAIRQVYKHKTKRPVYNL